MQTELKLPPRREEVVTIAQLETWRKNAEVKSNALLIENEVLTGRCVELYSKLVECTARKEKATKDIPRQMRKSTAFSFKMRSSIPMLRSLEETLTLEIMVRP